MKRILIMGLLISMMNVACARDIQPKTPQQRAAHRTQVLKKELNLNADQATKVESIMLLQATRMDSLKTTVRASRKANQQVRKSIKQATDQKMNSILTPEQQARYANWKQQKQEKRKAAKQAAS